MVKLSLLVTIGALLGNVSWASAKSNFGRRTFILPQKNADHVNTNTDAAISVRGGGQYEDIAKKAYYVLMASQGLTTALAPEKTGDILFNGAFTVDEDSLSSFLVGYAGSSFIGCLYMAMLAFSTSMDAPTIIAHGTYPCALMSIKNLLQDKFAKHGFHKGTGVLMTLATVGLPVAIRSGKYDSNALATADVLFPLVCGIIGFFDCPLAMKLSGHQTGDFGDDEKTKAFSGWYFSAVLTWAIVATSLLKGVEPNKAVGYSALFLLVDLLDKRYIRKSNAPLNIDDAPLYLFYLVLGGICWSLLG